MQIFNLFNSQSISPNSLIKLTTIILIILLISINENSQTSPRNVEAFKLRQSSEPIGRGCSPLQDGYMCNFYKTCGKSFGLDSGESKSVNNKSISAYILNGSDIGLDEFPSFAQIDFHFGKYKGNTCSGVIVSDKHIATAAHCFVKKFENLNDFSAKPIEFVEPKGISVFVGLGNRNFKFINRSAGGLRVVSYCLHPNYQIDSLLTAGFDSALITLENRLEFNNYIQPACWPYDMELIDTYSQQSQCYQIGIGISNWIEIDWLKMVMTMAKRGRGSERNRNEHYDDDEEEKIRIGKEKSIVQKMEIGEQKCPMPLFRNNGICFKAKDQHENASACFGDSGGPALCFRSDTKQWTVVGLMSRSYEPDGIKCPSGSRTVLSFPNDQLDSTTTLFQRQIYDIGCPKVWSD